MAMHTTREKHSQEWWERVSEERERRVSGQELASTDHGATGSYSMTALKLSDGRVSAPSEQGHGEVERVARVEVPKSTKASGTAVPSGSGRGQSLAEERPTLAEQHLTEFETSLSDSMPSVEKIP